MDGSRGGTKRAAWAIAVAVMALSAAGLARAQNASPMLIPNQRGNQSGEVLEIPRSNNQTKILPPGVPPELAPQPGAEVEIPSRQLRTQPGYAQVTVTVTNSSGVHITDLTQKDFEVYEDNQRRPTAFFRRDTNTPVSVGILVDTSGSMDTKIPQARLAISNFVRDLNPQDDVFLFAFSDRPFLLQPFTTNHDAVLSRLALLHAFGRTALYDVILDGLIMVSRGRYDKKALLVVTDGMDTASASELQQVVLQARRQGVLIYSIGIGNPNTPGTSISIGAFIFGGSDLDRVDAQVLQTLSAETGAKTFIVSQVGDGDLLNAACEAISNELREQYTLGFVSADPSAGGYRGVKVEIPSRPDLRVRVRKGVTVGHNPTYAAGSGSGSSDPP